MDAIRKLKFVESNRGMAVVYIALLIFVLFFFAAFAVDFTYMYVAKGQLQNAADAAALAGAAKLDGTNSIIQTTARESAFALASSNYVVPSKTAVQISHPIPTSNFDTADNTLTSTNDVIVGHWNGRFSFNNTSSINAVLVRARRTADSPGKSVTLFFSRIFGWTSMQTEALAVATAGTEPTIALPLCIPTCGFTTPLTVNAGAQNVTPGVRFFLKTQDGSPNIGWTSFFEGNTNSNTIQGYIDDTSTVPSNLCGNCIHTTNGIVNPVLCDLLAKVRERSANHNVNGVNVFGWKGLIPILDNNFVCPGGHAGCLTDPGNQPGDPFRVVAFAEVIITDVVPAGNCAGISNITGGKPGIVLVGTGPSSTPNTSSICCVPCPGQTISTPCTSPPAPRDIPPRLVQ